MSSNKECDHHWQYALDVGCYICDKCHLETGPCELDSNLSEIESKIAEKSRGSVRMKTRREKALELMLRTMEDSCKQLITELQECHTERINFAAENASLRNEVIRLQAVVLGLRSNIAEINGLWGTEEG